MYGFIGLRVYEFILFNVWIHIWRRAMCEVPVTPIAIEGVIYLSPFWNHILAKKGRFIHVRSQISWYVCSMYLGTKGDFFSYTCTFCALLPRCCALLCFPTYVPYVQFLILRILRTACVLLLTICRHTIFPRESEKKSFGSTYAKKIEAKKTSRSTIHVICQR